MVSVSKSPNATDHLTSGRRTLALEIQGLQALLDTLDGPFSAAVDLLAAARGRVIVTGMGKSGHVGRKIAATLASTGTPAQYVHPAEAGHGDLGMITNEDAILGLSWSGETAELAAIIAYAKRFSIPLVAITSDGESALGSAANVALVLPRAEEACPNGLAPTTSTTMQLALGDAISVALLEQKGFSASDFRIFHPGGKLGASLQHIADLMHKGDALPLVTGDRKMSDALLVMSEKGFGCLGIVNAAGDLTGIVTDGDLRRHMGENLLGKRVEDVMTRNPKTITPAMLASEALNHMNAAKITSMFVVEKGKPVGLVHIHDFLRAGVV
ncbi:MAG: KpsF/GutQ family sugar-phosphate isomerase [Rhizobiales bacterium]|nr:KpsF/GutQ family sugar-phosphate isomerase [Hyphomicrobiales bacterium]